MTSTPQTVSRLGRERRRQLIQQFQNEVAEDDPMNPDSKSFDAKKYFKDLLRSKALPDLMKVDSELAKEIKILDGNVKTLVYDNYSKFITAADTIKKMKGNVENMEEEMSKLKVNIEKISQASTQITETLASKREKIEQLSGQHRLLQKLQFLVELPQNLEQAIKLEAYSEAVRRWVRTDPILVKYSQIQSFKNIYSTCIAIVERLRGLLKDKLAQKETSSEDLAEYVGLLIDLKESPATLRTDYLENRRQVLVSKLETFKDYQFLSATKPSSEASTLLEGAVESQPQNSPSETDDNPAVYSRDVLQSLASDEQNEYGNFVKDISRTFFPTFIGFAVSFEQLFIKKEKSAAERANAASMFNTTSRHHLFSYYFDIVRSQLLRADSAVKVLGALQTQANSFGRVEEELDMLHFGRESDTLNISLNELSYNLIQSVLNSYLEQEFNSLQKRIEQLLTGVTRATDATKVNEPGYLSEIVIRSVNQIRSDIDQLLLKFKPFFVVTKKGYFLEKHCTGFVAKIGIKMQQLFLYTTTVVLSKFVEMESKDEQHVRGLLLLSKICLELRKTLPQIQTSLAMLLQLTDQTRLDFGVNVQDLAATLYEPAQRLLGQFVRLSGQQLGLMLHRAIDSGNWLKRREPQAVEMVIDLVVDELAALHRLVGRLFDDDLRNKVRRDNRRLRQQSATADIDQLFSRRVQYFGSVELYQSNILAAIIKICLKNMLESVRMRTFSTHGYQQIQVDTHFMRLALADYVDDETLLDVVLDQVLAGTADRTLDPQHLDLSVVNKICEDLLRKRRERTSATPTSTQ